MVVRRVFACLVNGAKQRNADHVLFAADDLGLEDAEVRSDGEVVPDDRSSKQ